ncbi:MAG: hypothetical protein J6Y57_04770 [Lachnospiraceae bacterium]|nr:hypothetical protein [Lachnospiraceae bacterium]
MKRYKAILSTILAAVLMAGALSACGTTKPAEAVTEPAAAQAEEPDVAEAVTEQEEVPAEEPAEDETYDVCTVYLGGAENATDGMERVDDQFNDDGSYRTEHVSDDGMLSVCEVGRLWDENKPASEEEAAVEMAHWILLEGDTASEETVALSEEYTANTSYPVYVVSFLTGSNEDTWSWKAFTLSTDTCGLVYAIGAPADYDQDMIAMADTVFPELVVIDKDEDLETNDGIYKTDLSAYYGMHIDDVAVDFPDLQYDDSYKNSETTDVSEPADMMERRSDGIALGGPFFTIDNAGNVVAVSYGGQTYCICEITVGMPMSEAADLAKMHDFQFSYAEIAHGTATYVSVYDNGEMLLCISSDAEAELGKLEESDVTGNVEFIVLTAK